MVQAIPEGTGSVVPYLCVRGAKKAIEFYEAAFGAELVSMMPMGDDAVGHADLKIGNSRLYLADEMPGWGAVRSPKGLKGSSVNIHLWVEDCDAVFAQALAAGATVTMPLTDQFWGDRYGMLTDPFGHVWAISTHKEDLTPEEMMRRGDEAMAHMAEFSAPPASESKSKANAKSQKKSKATVVPGKKSKERAKAATSDKADGKSEKKMKAEKKAARKALKKATKELHRQAKKEKKDKKREKKSKP